MWSCEVKQVTEMTNLFSLLHNTGSQAPAHRRQTAASWVWNSVLSSANIRLPFAPSVLSPLFLSVTPRRKQLQICFGSCVGGFLLALLTGSAPQLEVHSPSLYGSLSSLTLFIPCLFLSVDNSQDSQDPGVPEQFTGLLHGSSPVFDSAEEPFMLPGVPLPAKGQKESRKTAKVKEEVVVAAAKPPPSRPSMAAILTDCDPKAIYATVIKEHRDSGAGAVSAGRMRPPGDLKLARSLSKSDSDLLVSPPSEEDGGLGNRSESVSNCSTGKKRLEKSPSFTSEWDEVSVWSLTLLGTLCLCTF